MKFNFCVQKTLFLLLVFATLQAFSQVQTNQVYDPELNLYITKPTFENSGDINPQNRKLRYRPDGEDFVIVNGKNRFNRALYGTNTGFRVETGDVPEFALYLPRMGGNLSFGIRSKKQNIQLNDADRIESRYRAGARIYNITDSVLGKGRLTITALAIADAEGLILKIETYKIADKVSLNWTFGGCADKRFSREGDLGVDAPDCFYLKPEYCAGNEFSISGNTFQVVFGAKKDRKLTGIFPEKSKLTVTEKTPVLKSELKLKKNTVYYLLIQIPENKNDISYADLASIFNKAEEARKKTASQIHISTPDPYFNTLGSTLSMAADGIWSGETWLHGAVGWRMPLSGWRAAYTGDVLGWHDRSRKHFNAYAASQVNNVTVKFPHPTQDSALNFARSEKKWGTEMYSNGYICRNPNRNDQMHHYDMNLCYIDELLWHFNWTGDTVYVRQMWPVLTSHLAWEKRNFDPDNDGLYDAYCCIWASDALYYNSGGVTHSSAYNYRANKMAAELAKIIGQRPEPFQNEADKILKAINSKLWLQNKGHWAEFQDFMGNKTVHENAAVWTIYHAIDSEIHDVFKAFQATYYIDTEIPHIPVEADGLEKGKYKTISTSNWTPYSWSINNVAFAEIYHTALAYWQAGRYDEGYNLLKSAILDGMYIGASPGNVGQISFYDAARGECYRDFGDPTGMLSRALVQGLYGIYPDMLHNKLLLKPGFPQEWDNASIATPDIRYSYNKVDGKILFNIQQSFARKLDVDLKIPVNSEKINFVTVNGDTVAWKTDKDFIGLPLLSLDIPASEYIFVEINISDKKLNTASDTIRTEQNSNFNYQPKNLLTGVYDPQNCISGLRIVNRALTGKATGEPGKRLLFLRVRNENLTWWQPLYINIAGKTDTLVYYPAINKTDVQEVISLDKYFNDSVTHIFSHKYLSPRSPYTTLQIPVQGIGEWCHPLTTAKIDDSGLRKLALENNNILRNKTGIDFSTPAAGKNIIFTSLWDNFPSKIDIPVAGNATAACFVLAGSTNHMQSHIVNGVITATYTDGTTDKLNLINPENWCPIEQDYYFDGKAFTSTCPRPYRIHLKSGIVSNQLGADLKISGVYGREIDGGAGVILTLPLNKNKKLAKISVETVANEVIIGLMSLTLLR